jgi:hypothetical protein
MTLKYQSGEEIRKNDRVLFHGEPARVDFAVVDRSDPETEWYMQEFGGGVMVVEGVGGTVFLPTDELNSENHLEFVSRESAGK